MVGGRTSTVRTHSLQEFVLQTCTTISLIIVAATTIIIIIIIIIIILIIIKAIGIMVIMAMVITIVK